VRMPCWNDSSRGRFTLGTKLFLCYDHKYPHCTVISCLETSSQPMYPSFFNSLCFCPTEMHTVGTKSVPVFDSVIDCLHYAAPPGHSMLRAPVHGDWPGRERTKAHLTLRPQKCTDRKSVEPWWCKL
jgi:hypothetical protein